jgi:heat shock protein HtpX
MGAIIRTATVFIVLGLIMGLIGALLDLVFGFQYIFLVLMLIVLVLISVFTVWNSKSLALRANKAHIITREEEPRLYATVEKVAAKAGMPMPEVGISEYSMPNAFATGRSPSNAAVVATRGILNILDDDELEGVISHEMSHVKNRDILVMSVTSTVVSALTLVSRFAFFSTAFGNSRDRNGGLLIIALMIVAYILAPLAGVILQMAVSRSREYLADETGARITGKPLALASALYKLENGCQMPRNAIDDTAHASMWISEPAVKKKSIFQSLFSTHPDTSKRIERLEAIARKMKSGEVPEYTPDEKYGNHTGLSIE